MWSIHKMREYKYLKEILEDSDCESFCFKVTKENEVYLNAFFRIVGYEKQRSRFGGQYVFFYYYISSNSLGIFQTIWSHRYFNSVLEMEHYRSLNVKEKRQYDLKNMEPLQKRSPIAII